MATQNYPMVQLQQQQPRPTMRQAIALTETNGNGFVSQRNGGSAQGIANPVQDLVASARGYVQSERGGVVYGVAPNGGGNTNRGAQIQRLHDQLANVAEQEGISMQDLLVARNGNGGNGGSCATPMQSQMLQSSIMAGAIIPGQYVPWAPDRFGPCPNDLPRYLCWMMRGSCSFNKFAVLNSVALRTNTINLPDPVAQFNIGPEGNAQSLGVFFPRIWCAEAAMHGQFRYKVSFSVNVIAGEKTEADINRDLMDDLSFRIIQVGTEDNLHTAVDIGQAQDAEAATNNAPILGGFWMPEGHEFVPFALAPELFSFDFRGQAPGQVGVDSYTVQARVQTYWRYVC